MCQYIINEWPCWSSCLWKKNMIAFEGTYWILLKTIIPTYRELYIYTKSIHWAIFSAVNIRKSKRYIHRIKTHYLIKTNSFKKYRWKCSTWAFIMLGTSSKSLLSQCKLTLSLFNGMNNGTNAYVSRSKCIDVTKTG